MPDPPRELRQRLTVARRQGIGFDEAWDSALNGRRKGERIRFPHPTPERRAWREVLEEMRGVWEAAYSGEAEIPGGPALVQLAELLAEADEQRPSPPSYVPLVISEPESRRRAA